METLLILVLLIIGCIFLFKLLKLSAKLITFLVIVVVLGYLFITAYNIGFDVLLDNVKTFVEGTIQTIIGG